MDAYYLIKKAQALLRLAKATDDPAIADRMRELAIREDRIRVARDLHDGVLQSLTGVRLELQAIAAASTSEPGFYDRLLAIERALALLANQRVRVGIYAGMGCMNYSPLLTQVAEMLHAPVATSVSGKGVISECHPLAVGWGYGPQGTATAEDIFKHVDLVLAIGVRYSEVSTGFYAIPKHKRVIHVDINPHNLGKVVKAEVCVHADAGVFLQGLEEQADNLRRPTDERLRDYQPGADPQLEALLFQYGRYLLIASSRPGTQPANLQGIWNELVRPPWRTRASHAVMKTSGTAAASARSRPEGTGNARRWWVTSCSA